MREIARERDEIHLVLGEARKREREPLERTAQLGAGAVPAGGGARAVPAGLDRRRVGAPVHVAHEPDAHQSRCSPSMSL